jgi:hypothetical protein
MHDPVGDQIHGFFLHANEAVLVQRLAWVTGCTITTFDQISRASPSL